MNEKSHALEANETPKELVIRRLNEAVITLHRLPEKSYRQGFSRYWPKTVNHTVRVTGWPVPVLSDSADLTNHEPEGRGVYHQGTIYKQDTLPSYLSPTPRQITEMDQALPWLFLLMNDTTRRIVAMRSRVHHISLKPTYSWAKIAEETGLSVRAVKRCYEDGIANIAKQLKFSRATIH